MVHKVLECFHATTALKPRCFLHKALDRQFSCLRIQKGWGQLGRCSPWQARQSSLGHVFLGPSHLLPCSKPSPPPLS